MMTAERIQQVAGNIARETLVDNPRFDELTLNEKAKAAVVMLNKYSDFAVPAPTKEERYALALAVQRILITNRPR